MRLHGVECFMAEGLFHHSFLSRPVYFSNNKGRDGIGMLHLENKDGLLGLCVNIL